MLKSKIVLPFMLALVTGCGEAPEDAPKDTSTVEQTLSVCSFESFSVEITQGPNYKSLVIYSPNPSNTGLGSQVAPPNPNAPPAPAAGTPPARQPRGRRAEHPSHELIGRYVDRSIPGGDR